MNVSKLFIVITVLVLAAAVLSAQTTLGTIQYMEGEVDVLRNGEPIGIVSVGTSIEPFDTVETGADGYVEVAMNAPSAGSLVKVKSGTAFYFEGTPEKSNFFRTTFQLLRGSLSMRVGRLTGKESYQVQTDNAVAAVRGTDFNVDMTPDRSVLITVPEGRVETSTGGRRVAAQPGVINVIDSGSSARELRVSPEDVELYREYWRGLRQEALRINARLSIQQYSRQWDRDYERLQSAMRELNRHNDIFAKWGRIVRDRSELPSTGDAIRDKRTLSRGMLELRATLPLAERSFETLVGLEEAWRAGYAEGSFSSGAYADASAFYRSFRQDKRQVRRLLSQARRMIQVYRLIDRTTGQNFESGTIGIMDGMPTL